MIEAHLPILLVVVPLTAAPVCVLVRRSLPAWSCALAAGWAVLAMAFTLLTRVLEGGPVSYALGGWEAPWGIQYRVDEANAFVLLFVALIAALALLYAPASAGGELPRARHHLFYATFLLCLTGLLGMTITGDVFNVFVFLEISSLASYALIGLGADRRALTASYRYLIMGTVGATFFVIGIGLLYMTTGTLDMVDMASRLQRVAHGRTILVALAFLSVGLSLKVALFPLHLWLPNAYTYAPSVVTAFLAGTATKVAAYVYMRFVFTIFGAEFVFSTMKLDAIVIPLAALGVLVASAVAVFQNNIKRMLAYSSIAQIGYIMLGVGLVSVTGLTASLVHMLNHALIKATLFLAVGSVFRRLGSVELEDMRGLGRRMPWTMAAFVIAALGLIGVPLTAGFVSKWYLVLAALEQDRWLLAGLVLLASLIAVVYIWRVVEAAYFQDPPAQSAEVAEAPLSTQIPVWILVGAVLYFGVSTSLSAGVARRAAAMLLEGAP